MDSSNNTGDANFWASGSVYRVVLNSAKTVDGRLISGIPIGEFSIEAQTADIRKVLGVATTTGFQRATNSIGFGTVGVGSTPTSVVSSACTPAGASVDQYKGKLIVFAADTTTAGLRGAVGLISASTNAAAPTFTVSTLPGTPVSGDTFTIS